MNDSTRAITEEAVKQLGKSQVEAYDMLKTIVGAEALKEHPEEIADVFNRLGNEAILNGYQLGYLHSVRFLRGVAVGTAGAVAVLAAVALAYKLIAKRKESKVKATE